MQYLCARPVCSVLSGQVSVCAGQVVCQMAQKKSILGKEILLLREVQLLKINGRKGNLAGAPTCFKNHKLFSSWLHAAIPVDGP